MLLTKIVKLKWNSKITKHYKDLGYQYTHMGDEFDVRVEDLTHGSQALVTVICDFCGCEFNTKWELYYKQHQKACTLDCCTNSKCTTEKAKFSIKTKYGVDNVRQLDFVNQKIAETNIARYGCENPFGNADVQNKIKSFYRTNYGVEHNMQLSTCVEKARETSVERYGKPNYSQTEEYRERFSGSNNPKWKGDAATTKRNGRELPIYRDWRKAVFGRDFYTCKCCGARNGNGKYIRLEAHHIRNWKDNPNLRYDVNNGITLCSSCHTRFHKIYGKKQTTPEQLQEFFQQNHDKKIC